MVFGTLTRTECNISTKQNAIFHWYKNKSGVCQTVRSTNTTAKNMQRCCYILVDFAIAASQNGVCITQQMFLKMVLFRDCSLIKDENNKKYKFFCHFLNNIGLLMKGKILSIKSVKVI